MENVKKKPSVISIATSKGGVGKTTTTVALAEFLAKEGYNILVIDADYQANCSIVLIGNDNWNKLNEENRTIKAIMEDAINEGKPNYTRQFNSETHLFKGASNLTTSIGNRIDLLASTPDVNEVRKNLYRCGNESQFKVVNRVNFLEWALSDVFDKYDFVLIDTHPDIDDMLNAALYISDYVLTPIIPDAVSSYGLKTLNTYIQRFSRECRRSLKLLGVLFSMVRHVNIHRTYKEQISEGICKTENIPVINTEIPLRAKIAESLEYDSDPSTFKNKYGEVYDNYEKVAQYVIKQTTEQPKIVF